MPTLAFWRLRSQRAAGNDPSGVDATAPSTPTMETADEPSGSERLGTTSGIQGGRGRRRGEGRCAAVEGSSSSGIPLFDVESEVQRKVLDLVS